MAKKKRRQNKKSGSRPVFKYEITGLGMTAASIIGMAKLGIAGAAIVQFFRFFAGEWYILYLLALAAAGVYVFWYKKSPDLKSRRLIGAYLITGAVLLLTHISLFEGVLARGGAGSSSVIRNTWELYVMQLKGGNASSDLGGGMLGALLFAATYFLFAAAGSKLVASGMIIAGLLLITDKSLQETLFKIFGPVFVFFKKQFFAFLKDMRQLPGSIKKKKQKTARPVNHEKKTRRARTSPEEDEDIPEEETIPVSNFDDTIEPIISSFADRVEPVQEQEPDKEKEKEEAENAPPIQISFSELENKDYKLPPVSLLKQPKHNGQAADKKNIYENARKLEKTFQSFGVKAKVTQVHLGPAVTKYEVYPDTGVKVSRIVNLSDDLALALAAKDIRIEAPIPGKSAIGIEVPNSEVAMVSLREVIDNPVNDRPDAKLLIGLGRDISGEAVLAEMNKMPHLLVAGATGSGKSVCINGIITSILMRAKPHEVKMMMIDPKMVELNVYNGIPHLLAPVVTDPKKASQALKKVVNEMERRYELFSHTGTRNIEGYNENIRRANAEEGEKHPELPYIVVIVDELADLMMVASSDVEDSITRLSQMARAAGIHLIIATQRPSVDVITGVIKANIPSRIAFSVSSMTDSRTILDMGGAEKLLGRGDMLFLPVGASKPVRVQGAFLSDEEVEEVVDFVIGQQKAQYQENMIPAETAESAAEVNDDLYEEAVQLVVDMQTASVSMLQRRFRVGYTRAARLIDAMEERGVVGPYEGSKPREVLISKTQHDEMSS
ncbi:cell division protein FtsK [Bacillus mangrovi]|uniref:Cell division protein FtsK n=1 Tax=Metabacillus mangrovi TaxID=1491830 RepID=A0A7X2S2T2_9BACI|nr:DNA translocase FtsK [Metabacillus mangrovi]MTH51771.1 cell division protein FtsK [Metabacillus mangrovi]